jgi:aldose sugar dehydrogenase
MKNFFTKKCINALLLIFPAFLYSQALNPELTLDRVLINLSSSPWGMAFLNSDELLYTEKTGRLNRYKISTNVNTNITGLPTIAQNGQGGLLDVALHPDFNTNQFVYLAYCIAGTGGHTTAIGRGRLVNNTLQNFTEIFRALPFATSGNHFGCRLVFDREKLLYISIGDRGTMENAQNTNIHPGKVLRLKDDGSVPSDNPLVGVQNTRPEIFTWGNRNIQGMAMNPANGKIYAHEHGPRGGDELNLIEKGKNYGWPRITFGVDYSGTIISSDTAQPGLEQPLTYWVPSIAPSGLVFVQSGQATNEANVLIGALAGTHLHWLKMRNDKVELATRNMQGYARFRDVEQAPDGKLYALTESPNRLILLKSNIVTSVDAETETNELNSYVFPNPSSGELNLRINSVKNTNTTVRIWSNDGKLVQPETKHAVLIGENNISLNTETLPKGFYLIELNNGDKNSMLHWVKN